MYKGYNSDTQPRQKVGINRIIHTFVDWEEREREKKNMKNDLQVVRLMAPLTL